MAEASHDNDDNTHEVEDEFEEDLEDDFAEDIDDDVEVQND